MKAALEDNNISGVEGAIFRNIAESTIVGPGTANQTINATGNTINSDGSEGLVAYNHADDPEAEAVQTINLSDNSIGLDGAEGGLGLINYIDGNGGGSATQNVELHDNETRYAIFYNWVDTENGDPAVATQTVDLKSNSFAEGLIIANGAEGTGTESEQSVYFSSGDNDTNTTGGTYIENYVDNGGTATQLVDLGGSSNALSPVFCTGDATQTIIGGSCEP